MARPKTKEELIQQSQLNFKKLMDHISQIPSSKRNSPFKKGSLNRNIRDVLSHLHHWHAMMLEWYKVGMNGDKPEMPAKGYTWRTVPELNKWIWEQYQEVGLDITVSLLNESFSQIQGIINKHSEEELFTKKRFHWTGSTSLGAYLISASSSHYDWALKLIKKQYEG